MNSTWSKVKKIHFVGIKGVAMAALAVYIKERGMRVTGSDVDESFPSDTVLDKAGIAIERGFDPQHITKKAPPDLVIYTGANDGRDNPEVQVAVKCGIPVLSHGQALGMVMHDKKQISVAGSHGKTTTTAMIATILTHAGWDPSYAIGCGEIFGLGLPGHFGKSDYFVAEADEYMTEPRQDMRPRFLWQHPSVLVVTNIDYDHPDAYASLEAVQRAFVLLQNQQVGIKVTVVNGDDPASRVLIASKDHTLLTYGASPSTMLQMTHVGYGSKRTFFSVARQGVPIGEFSLKVPGKHNALNALAAACACEALGVSWEKIRSGLLAFEGTKRRFEKVGEMNGVVLYDDYAHHPAEIKATLVAARAWYPNHRIVSVFQPHTYSRTKALMADFARSFGASDLVVVTDIYGSKREEGAGDIRGETLAQEMMHHHARVFYANDKEAVIARLRQNVMPGDLVILMGAGDIYTWRHDVLKSFS